MQRRTLLAGTAGGIIAAALPAWARADAGTPGAIEQALQHFGAITANTAVCLRIQRQGGAARQHAHQADQPLFVGSAVKTFILAQYLKEVEAGRQSEDMQVGIGPEVWSPGSPVFIKLQGTTAAKSVLEAMISHSDNTATDAALKAVGPDSVRALIQQSGLRATRIPDSTRILFSYLAGAPDGTDLGWQGMEQLQAGHYPGAPRSPMNERQTMQSTAAEMAQWYEQVLAGKVFREAGTLAEFKRISAMADAMPMMVPPDIMAYGKGGSIDWEGFHCFCGAGQMVQPTQRTSFCFIVNWQGPDESVPKMFTMFAERSRAVLALVAGQSNPAA